MRTTVKKWIRGAFGAFVGGFAGAMHSCLSVSIVDPHDFNLGDGLWNVVRVAVAGAVVGGVTGLALYIKQSPLPPDEEAA